jgi:serine/threonine protein kinase/Tol biopolymer transport system component
MAAEPTRAGGRWSALSSWHNAWLQADADERDRLRAALAADRPDLAAEADSLAVVSGDLRGFLETPALILASQDLAQDVRPFSADAMVGPYRIVGLLARGGMGDVYRATDVRLHRDVALKLLAHEDIGDPLRLERFVQEARVTASLDDANIVRLFDVGMFEGRPYLVTELLEGETLRARLERGPLLSQEGRDIARGVARGLVAAHAAGLVHRDLKPENIFLPRSGTTKILDFGIAKLAQDAAVGGSLSTSTGALLGTVGYLAPEQVLGQAVDGRTDLFALGVILFEALTGHRAFAREHTIDTLYAIAYETAPIDLLDQCGDVPAAFSAIVKRLLEKAPARRFQSAVDLVWTLGCLAEAPGGPRVADLTRRRVTRWWDRWTFQGAAAVTIALLGAVGWWWLRAVPPPDVLVTRPTSPTTQTIPTQLTRAVWTLPEGDALNSAPVVSPNGRLIAFISADGSGRKLLVRPLDSLEATAVVGSEGAKQPFWSPDGSSIGFFANGKLLKVALGGGAPVVICDAPDARGGAWSRSGTIVFGPDLFEAALSRVASAGGRVEAATRLDLTHGENSHRWPVFLPDGIHFLYFVRSSIDERRGVYIGRLDRPATLPGTPLFRSESEAVYAPPASAEGTGALLYVSGGRIEARLFDADRLTLVGDAHSIAVAAGGNGPYHSAMLSASSDLLAFASAPQPYGVRLRVVAMDGSASEMLSESGSQNWPRLSPDGRRLARQRIDVIRGNPDLWVDDLERHTRVRVTTAPDNDVLPVWSPEGGRLAYVAGRSEERFLSIAGADGSGVVDRLSCPGSYCEPTDWSPDGKWLAVNLREGARQEVWAVSADRTVSSHPLLAEAFIERDARFSPDGRWIAYVSEESGRPEVSIHTVSGPPRRFAISSGGGDQPVWRRDGSELFFVTLQGHLRSLSVRVFADGRVTLGVPVERMVPPIGSGHWGTQYDVSPDGTRVYFLQTVDAPLPHEIGLIQGWRALLH